MSSQRFVANDGEGVTSPDVQVIANAAASAEDRALELLATPGSAAKVVMPLEEDSASLNAGQIVIPGTGVGTNQGKLKLLRCSLIAAVQDAIGYTVDLEGTVKTAQYSALVAANSSGSTRYDLLYGSLTRTVLTTGLRKVKSAADGSVSPQTLTLTDSPEVTLSIVSSAVSAAAAIAALPADTSTGWNFPLALLVVANGFASGDLIVQSAITPLWKGGWLLQRRIQAMRPMGIFAAGLSESPALNAASAAKISTRWGSSVRFFGVFNMLAASATFTLDTTIDWRRRIIWGWLVKSTDQGGSTWPFPSALTVLGSAGVGMLDPGYSAAGHASDPVTQILIPGTGLGGTDNRFKLIVTTVTGGLRITVSGGPADNVSGDHWSILVEATDQIPTTPV